MQPVRTYRRLNPSLGGLAVVFIIMVGLYFVIIISPQNDYVHCKTSPAEFRMIIYSDFDVNELWSLHAKIPNFSSFSPLTVANSLLMIAQTCDEVTGIALNNGNILWHSDTVITPSDLALDMFHNQIYVTAQEQVRAIDISTGKTDWVNASQILKKNPPPVSVTSNGKVIAYARYEGIRYLDPATGILSDAVNLPQGSFLLDSDISYLINEAGKIQAVDITANKIKWASNIVLNGRISLEDMRPDLQENLLILRKSGFLAHPIFIDKTTGEQVWESSNKLIVSNVFVYHSNAYMLTSDAELVVLNSQAGTQVGTIKFDIPAKTELLYSETGIGGSWVAAIDDMIFIYFQDTDVLSAYKIKSKK